MVDCIIADLPSYLVGGPAQVPDMFAARLRSTFAFLVSVVWIPHPAAGWAGDMPDPDALPLWLLGLLVTLMVFRLRTTLARKSRVGKTEVKKKRALSP